MLRQLTSFLRATLGKSTLCQLTLLGTLAGPHVGGAASELAGPADKNVSAPAKPNFIFINIDDMGYADIGPFGSTLNRTPHLDRMAKEGKRLTSFYAAPVCSPSRAALMTGCYPKRALPIPHVLFPAGQTGLATEEVTVAEVLKTAGYATAIVGKWHLGDQPEFLPTRQGFDSHFGLPYSNDMGPAEDGVKSDLGKPLPAQKGKGQPPLPLLRNGKVVKRVLPDDQQSLVELYTTEGRPVHCHAQGRALLPLPRAQCRSLPHLSGQAMGGQIDQRLLLGLGRGSGLERRAHSGHRP